MAVYDIILAMEENITPIKQNKQQISTPTAIIAAGFIIMVGILLSKNGIPTTPKTLSEQVGVSKEELNKCIQGTDLDALGKRIDESVDKAMSNYPKDNRGTPYTVVVGLNGVKMDIRGQETYENMKKVVDDAMIGKVTTPYVGNIVLSEPYDHVVGNADAKVTIIEYADFECPFCKGFQPTLKRIVQESNGNVRWIYRNFPLINLHQHAFEKAVAAECIAKIKGNDAFWKYGDLLFGLLKTAQDPISDQL